MNLKTYQAQNMPEALAMVKQDLGRNAVILHTRTFKQGGLLGFGAKSVVEITASNNVNVVPRNKTNKPRTTRQKKQFPQPPLTNAYDTPPTPSSTLSPNSPNASPLLQKTYGTLSPSPTPPTLSTQQPQTSQPSQNFSDFLPPSTPTPQPHQRQPPHTTQQSQTVTDPKVVEELEEIKRLVHRMMQKQSHQPSPDLPQQLFDQYLALLEQEVAHELADDVITAVNEQLSEKQKKNPDIIRQTVEHEVARMIPTDTTALNTKTKDGRPLTIALTGPTGVGKTTTIAKLAATFKLKQNKKVGLITIDTYRIAAVDQLQTYADIINIPLRVVITPHDMKKAIAECANCDVVLIDTAGRSQRDSDRLDELKVFLKAAKPHEVHLVLSSTCSQPVLMEAVDKFSTLAIDHIIFTKLDEAVSFGVLLNVLRRVDKRLSYITTGQEVPHQIEPGRSDRIAELIMGSGRK